MIFIKYLDLVLRFQIFAMLQKFEMPLFVRRNFFNILRNLTRIKRRFCVYFKNGRRKEKQR